MQSSQYHLNEVWVDVSELVLDPNNPRIHSGTTSRRHFKEEELIAEDVQNYVMKQMMLQQHDVVKLIDSMRTNGYINIDSIFVKRLERSGKYLVLEGNRRTTAIKSLISSPAKLDSSVLESISRVPVKELICDNQDIQADITDLILSIRHLCGTKNWAPMQQAYQIFERYSSDLRRYGGKQEFEKNTAVMERVANTLSLGRKDVEKALRVYAAFKQLKENEYLVNSDHYSLIELAVNNYPSLRASFFEVSEKSFRLSNRGLERFNHLCIEPGCKIQSPQNFRDFFHIFRDGSSDDLNRVLHGNELIADIKRGLGKPSRTFLTELDSIKKKLGSLHISQFTASSDELLLIKEIKEIVDTKLIPLIKRQK